VNPSWLEQLREQLSHQGLSPSYIERLVQELSDHFSDITEEKMSKDAIETCSAAERMGHPTDLAQVVGTEYRRWFFCRNHPVLTFIVLPIPLLMILWAVEVLIGSVANMAMPHFENVLLEAPLELITFVLLLTPPAFSGLILCRLARWSGQTWWWSMLSCGVVGVSANFVGFGNPSPFFGGPLTLRQLLMTAALPLAIGTWCSWQSVRRQRRSACPATATEVA
jgi:hypothetical protein